MHDTSSRPSRAVLAWLALLFLAQAPDALAYFDPASGSLVLQMVLGGIAGVAVVVKLYWHKLLDLLGIKTSSDEEDDDEGAEIEGAEAEGAEIEGAEAEGDDEERTA